MAENKITIHQAFYGEVHRAHSCIKQTIKDPDLTSFLIAFTDRPAALPPGVNLIPYISGSAFGNYYILTKTFPDFTATRAGMVFTHVLIINQSEIDLVNNFQDTLSLFVKSTENKNDIVTEIQIECYKTSSVSQAKNQTRYIQQTISAFVSGRRPILFSGNIETFSKSLQQIWNSPYNGARKKLKFRTSFTPSDIENLNDLTIVSIQKDFLPKWQGHSIIYGEHQDSVEITSHAEALFLGYKEENPFYNFLVELNVNLNEVQNYKQYEKVFENYINIEIIVDSNILRQDIRVLSKISPNPINGKKIKEKYIERLSTLLQNKQDTNLKGLRNINWSAFVDGESKGKQIVSLFISSEIENPNQKLFQQLSDLIDLSVNENEKNWWHHSITETIETSFKKQSKTSLINIWQLIDSSENTLKSLLSIISSAIDCDTILRKFIPEKLRVETCVTLASIAQKDNWFLFHADILLKQFSTENSLEKQLEIEVKLSFVDSVGVKYIAKKLTSEKLIELTLKTGDKKLIELSIEAIIKDFSLLTNIDFNISCWLEIWTSFVLKTRKVFSGLIGKEQATVSSILDLIVNGKTVNDIVLGLIADSIYSDISEYKNRSNVWKALSHLHKEKFLAPTTESILEKLLLGKIEVKSIESEISDRITSDAYVTKFLHKNRNDIEPVIMLFASFKTLKDNFLADYIAYYRGTISEAQANMLGELVNNYQFNKSARSIYEKAKHNNGFKLTYEICKELVTLNLWDFSFWGKQTNEPYKQKTHFYSNYNKEQIMQTELPIVVILTAIKDEYLAVRIHLEEIVDADQNDTAYETGIFSFNNRQVANIIIRECGAKNTNASQETERAIQYFKPNAIFFVGIAGSRKPNDFGIGDVIFPEKVYSYEGGKSDKDSFYARPDNALMSFTLMEKAKKERNKDDWKKLIKGQWNIEVKADMGIIASGEQVVEHYDSSIGKILNNHYNDTSAVEMEGFGFGKAANRQGRETSNILIGVVRGISDVIEQPTKSIKKEGDQDRRPANAKKLASDTAAAFAFWLIVKTFE